ncbi:MAG: hypothetical protein IPN10_01575, partial [Saprospiraceae bacterium]|nr:hypothetical protein [Saprospiraceae bacterium]
MRVLETCGFVRGRTDTMPGFAGSSCYFLRYMDPNNENEFASDHRWNTRKDRGSLRKGNGTCRRTFDVIKDSGISFVRYGKATNQEPF